MGEEGQGGGMQVDAESDGGPLLFGWRNPGTETQGGGTSLGALSLKITY